MRHAIMGSILTLALLVVGVGHTQSGSTHDATIRALIKAFAEARNAKDGTAAARLYSEDGEWISDTGSSRVKGRDALAKLWSGVRGQVQRTVQTITYPGDSIAVVNVETLYDEPPGRHHEIFVLVRDGIEWQIRIHQSIH